MASRKDIISQGGRKSLQLTSVMLLVSPLLFCLTLAQPDCGPSGPCAPGFCCSKWGYCGNTDPYCGDNCVSQCPGTPTPSPVPPSPGPASPTPPAPGPSGPIGPGVGGKISSQFYDQMFPNRNATFYTYDSFIEASKYFTSFGATGTSAQQSQDIAAFLAHVTHETAGLFYVEEVDKSGDYCSFDPAYPCVPGALYYGRGPIQISYNFNYGPCGDAIGVDLLSNPGLVATDPVISWKTALWFWTTKQVPKPACEAVMGGTWTPTQDDITAGRLPGFGETIIIVNGGLECGPGAGHPEEAADRVTQYTKICGVLGVPLGNNVNCTTMTPY